MADSQSFRALPRFLLPQLSAMSVNFLAGFGAELAASKQRRLLFGGGEDALPVQMSLLLAGVEGEAGEVPRRETVLEEEVALI